VCPRFATDRGPHPLTSPRWLSDSAVDLSQSTPAPAWYRQAGTRIVRNLPVKIIGTPAVIFVFFLAYRELLSHPRFPVTEMPLTTLDHLIRFWPPALALYVSLWVYVTIPSALLPTLRELAYYAWTIGVVCLVGLGCFFLWPTAVPPPEFDRAGYPGFDVLAGLDAAGNACPSLHVATAVFAAIWLDALLREIGARRMARIVSWIWCLAIVYSAMATKQHVAIDVATGAALGVAGALLAVRRWVPSAMPAPRSRRRGDGR
jgi:membrane-associated phospholipid phosphatase